MPATKQATRAMHVTCVLLGKQNLVIPCSLSGLDPYCIPDLIPNPVSLPDEILNRVQDTAHAAEAAWA